MSHSILANGYQVQSSGMEIVALRILFEQITSPGVTAGCWAIIAGTTNGWVDCVLQPFDLIHAAHTTDVSSIQTSPNGLHPPLLDATPINLCISLAQLHSSTPSPPLLTISRVRVSDPSLPLLRCPSSVLPILVLSLTRCCSNSHHSSATT